MSWFSALLSVSLVMSHGGRRRLNYNLRWCLYDQVSHSLDTLPSVPRSINPKSVILTKSTEGTFWNIVEKGGGEMVYTRCF